MAYAPPYTIGQFIGSVLQVLGNPAPDANVKAFMVGWWYAETGGHSGATFNPWNTEQAWPNSTDFNSAGVKNYATYSDGVEATVHVLNNGLYVPLVSALVQNNDAALGFPYGTPSAGVQRSLSNWTWGPNNPQINTGYIKNIFANVSKGGGTVVTSGGGGSGSGSGGGNPAANVPGALLNPESSIGAVCTAIDSISQLVNPFDATGSNFSISVTGVSGDPFGYFKNVGLNIWQDSIALWVRGLLILLGLIIVIRVLFRVLPIQQTAEAATQTAEKVAPLFL